MVWEARIHPSGPTGADPVRSEILYTNSSEERVYGRPTGAFVQDPMLWRSAAHPEDKDALPTIEALLPEGQWSGEYRLLRPNGTARWVETSIYAVGRSGRPTEPGDTLGPEGPERPFKLAGITRDIQREHVRRAAAAGRGRSNDRRIDRTAVGREEKAEGACHRPWRGFGQNCPPGEPDAVVNVKHIRSQDAATVSGIDSISLRGATRQSESQSF
ncbi:MAG: PAS domain-containing protein [Salinivenus sp.]